MMHDHKERARRLGAGAVAAERELDQLFGERRADAATVASGAERIGLLHGKLRAEHLNSICCKTLCSAPSRRGVTPNCAATRRAQRRVVMRLDKIHNPPTIANSLKGKP